MPLPENALFTGADLTGVLHRVIVDDDVAGAEKIVWGRVKALLNLDTRPASLDDTLAGQVLELGAIAYSNPEGLLRYLLEGEESFYDTKRWDEILEAIATGGVVAPGGVPRPTGTFPCAERYPDPARAGFGWCWGERW